MDSISKDPILQHHPETLQTLRKLYELDKPGAMDGAIDILDEWIKKQSHFMYKHFDRDYLERTIISCKGSVERAKSKLDKNCAMRTLMPHFYVDFNTKKDLEDLILNSTLIPLPQLTKDHYRICYLKLISTSIQGGLLNLYRYFIIVWEYMKKNDYLNGMVSICDLRDVNIMELVKSINVNELHQISTLIIEGIGLRIRGIYLLTPSTAIEVLVAILKKAITPKVAERVMVFKTEDSLHKYISKDILPIECGGTERSINVLRDEWFNVLSSEQHVKYMKEVKRQTTDERYRQTDEFNNHYLGIPGTFRALKVD